MPTMHDETVVWSKRVDATEGADFVGLPRDIDAAIKRYKKKGYKKGDPANFTCCFLAEAGKRVYGAARISVGHRTAYITYPGDEHSTRYILNDGDSKAVEAWDLFIDGGISEKELRSLVGDGIRIRFRAPSKSRQLKTMRADWHKNKRRWRKNTGRKQREGVATEIESVFRNGLRVNRPKKVAA